VLAAIGEPTALGEPASAPTVPAIQRGDASPAPSQEVSAEIFTNREIDVLILLAERLSDKEIAERLVLSPLTIKKHTLRIYRKLGVNSRRAAVVRASRLGLI
jgi:LuxR family maltose regulon positive regulatory protein